LRPGVGRFARLFRMLVKVDLLVIGDWVHRLSASQWRDLMAIVEDRLWTALAASSIGASV
jgi:hypothetical protein